MKAERRTIAPGTARKPASRKRFSPQPANFDGTLSHQVAPPGPPSMIALSLSRKDRITAFFSHWLTFQEFGPVGAGIFSATRALPAVERLQRRLDRVAHVAGRLGLIAARFSQACSISSLKWSVMEFPEPLRGGFLPPRGGLSMACSLRR